MTMLPGVRVAATAHGLICHDCTNEAGNEGDAFTVSAIGFLDPANDGLLDTFATLADAMAAYPALQPAMIYGAVIRAPGAPPSQVPPFAACCDADALQIVTDVATRAGASVAMVWESRDAQARRIA